MLQPMQTTFRWMLFGLLVTALAAVIFLWPRKAPVLDHRAARQLVLHYILSRSDDPVVVLGDSITEASTLPGSICGHPIVNAGLNGASTASDLGTWLSQALGGKRTALIIIALGTNDALVASSQDKQAFADRYGALIAQVSRLAPRVALVGIPPVQQQNRVTAEMARAVTQRIDGYNAALPEVAARQTATFVALDQFPALGTIDGVHLNAAGHQAWKDAVMRAAALVCG